MTPKVFEPHCTEFIKKWPETLYFRFYHFTSENRLSKPLSNEHSDFGLGPRGRAAGPLKLAYVPTYTIYRAESRFSLLIVSIFLFYIGFRLFEEIFPKTCVVFELGYSGMTSKGRI